MKDTLRRRSTCRVNHVYAVRIQSQAYGARHKHCILNHMGHYSLLDVPQIRYVDLWDY